MQIYAFIKDNKIRNYYLSIFSDLENYKIYDIDNVEDIPYLKEANGKLIIDEILKSEAITAQQKISRITQIKTRLNSISEDIIQSAVGETVPNLPERKEEFIRLHSELRAYENKEPREKQEEIL